MNIKALIKDLICSSFYSVEAPLSEAERLLAEIEETRKKMNYAWNRLNDAAPEYVEIAVLELLVIETQYGLLNKRYRLLQGINNETPYSMAMANKHKNHALYKALSIPTEISSQCCPPYAN